MKLATFSANGRTSIGVVIGETIVDIAGGDVPDTMEALLELGIDGMDAARRAAGTGAAVPLASVHLRAPVLRPRKYLGIAANYQSHIDEVLAANPDYVPPVYQRWFVKLPTSINGPYDPIPLPPESSQLDYEAELAIVIGKRCRRVAVEDAAAVIAGYTICNDVSVRDWQKRSPTIMLGKSFDGHGPLGPWIVTPEEIGDPHALRITCTVNGEVRQDGSTSEMINNCFEQIAYLSTVCTLEPGDVIATGTPFGTGGSMRPPKYLAVGDVVRCEIEKIGAIEAVIEAERV
ncbi:fumarylacetoacetate hydrolase family protein [Sphingomonas sp. So64.6b]|uniref:fumarylacetoacetate hydrolase family protein n=1 Tax=Sphingomonas sp. So64.6b TaxID=2997354 RepID=UPI0016037C55|nr:fumarylacetoacetate hydrolase family protein [Sphingomonas sp. So64.6b]QNA86450.1 fumarylacetoacetate hydrolase family protein [Sphingomonas sp. So64.6b]